MASDFVGYNVLVTLRAPPDANVQGVVADVIGQRLMLKNGMPARTSAQLILTRCFSSYFVMDQLPAPNIFNRSTGHCRPLCGAFTKDRCASSACTAREAKRAAPHLEKFDAAAIRRPGDTELCETRRSHERIIAAEHYWEFKHKTVCPIT